MEKVSMNKLEMARRAAKGGSGGTIQPATSEKLGGVKIGEGINVSEDGTISVPSYVPPAYSTEEVLTGRKWIDGKDIFEKVIVLDSAINVGTSWTDLGVSNANIEAMIHANGLHADGSFYPLILDLHNSEQATTVYAKASAKIDVKTLVLNYTKAGA